MTLYSLHSRNTDENLIWLGDKTAARLGINQNERIRLVYGNREALVICSIDSGMGNQTIHISENIIKALLMETKVKYEISFKNNKLVIGPVIGLLLGKKEERLQKSLHHFLIYTMLYEHINGVLFVFSEDQVNFEKEEIIGHLYDPENPNHWRKVTLPFPGSIFRRVEMKKRVFNKFVEKMGSNIFNAYYFDKWDFWKSMSPDSDIKIHLPETTDQINVFTMNQLIEKYKGVYLKPIRGSCGKGIYYIDKEGCDYKIRKNYTKGSQILSEEEMETFLGNNQSHLFQQPIRLHTFEDRKVDYRVILQKNENGHWKCTGIIGRFGKNNGISSNFKSNGFAKEGAEALKLQFGYSELQAFKKYQEIVEICIKVANKLTVVVGEYGDLGIDIGIDTDEKVWVIETNKRPAHELPLHIKDRKMYYKVKSNPVLYAKFLGMGGMNDTEPK
jgi:glutathione synthase/RimK-type ligase-like ATP-grasp enzyme